jgi:hypothetical protein
MRRGHDSRKQAISSKTIRHNFPALTLEQVYGAITFDLAPRLAVDTNIQEGEEDWLKWEQVLPWNPILLNKLSR